MNNKKKSSYYLEGQKNCYKYFLLLFLNFILLKKRFGFKEMFIFPY